jgi:hypothetical protein
MVAAEILIALAKPKINCHVLVAQSIAERMVCF